MEPIVSLDLPRLRSAFGRLRLPLGAAVVAVCVYVGLRLAVMGLVFALGAPEPEAALVAFPGADRATASATAAPEAPVWAGVDVCEQRTRRAWASAGNGGPTY